MNLRILSTVTVSALVFAGLLVGTSLAQQTSAPASKPAATSSVPAGPDKFSAASAANKDIDAAHLADAQKLINGGVKFLLDSRDSDGGWCIKAGDKSAFKPGLTAMTLKTLLQHPDFAPEKNSPVIAKGFEVLMSYRHDDGGFYGTDGQAAYQTALAIMAMKAAKNPQYNNAIDSAVKYIKDLQIVPGQESPDKQVVSNDDPRIGGVGYGKPPTYQPNLSVEGYFLDALEEAGVSKDDPAVQSALAFVTRLQNRSESNSQAFAKEGSEDGGFVYALGESKAGSEGGKGLRSYGTMTYVGFKSMLYAGLAKDDPRVQAAYNWIRKYWGLDSNPNLPDAQSQQGLYYFYHVFAKALRTWGEPNIKDAKGVEHNWRNELVDALKKRVRPDGSWSNKADRWEEGSSILVTCYSVLALQESLK